MIAGQEGKYGNWNKFVLEKVSEEQLQHAYGLVAMSEEVIKIQTNYIKEKQISVEERKKKIHETISADSTQTVKICMGVPITSKGTEMAEVVDSPFWSNLFDSFMKSVDWRSNRYIFRFYLGFDKADPLYDTGDAWSDMREEFKHRAIFRMTEQQMDEVAINNVLENFLSLKLMHFDHLEGSPSQVVSQLMLAGYRDNFDYFYQVQMTLIGRWFSFC